MTRGFVGWWCNNLQNYYSAVAGQGLRTERFACKFLIMMDAILSTRFSPRKYVMEVYKITLEMPPTSSESKSSGEKNMQIHFTIFFYSVHWLPSEKKNIVKCQWIMSWSSVLWVTERDFFFVFVCSPTRSGEGDLQRSRQINACILI